MILDLSFAVDIPVLDWYAVDFVAGFLGLYLVYALIKFVVSLITGG